MTIKAQHDPVAHRFQPDPDLLAHAHNQMLESEDPGERFVRQRYEEALGALRVAMAALREIHPTERYYLTPDAQAVFSESVRSVEDVVADLDMLEEEMLGQPMRAVLRGTVTTLEQFKELYE